MASPTPFQAGLAQAQAGDFAAAATLFAQALAAAPHPDAAANLGYCLRRLKRDDAAEAAYRHALALDPDHGAALLNLGSLCQDQGRGAEAEAIGRRLTALQPGNADACANLGATLFRAGQVAEARLWAERALAVRPDHPTARYLRASTALVMGDLAAGFRDYESRLALPGASLALDAGRLGLRRWTGAEPLAGRALLAVSEQGAGDTLNFVRYGALVRAAGGRMSVACHRPLARLLRAAPCLDGVVSDGDRLPPHDLHCPLLSLPAAFGTTLGTLPAGEPYLRVLPDWRAAWAPTLAALRAPGKPVVGFVWRGSPGHANDANRSLTLEALRPLLAHPGLTAVSLQVAPTAAEQAILSAVPGLTDLGRKLGDYADTAVVLDGIDLLVSVDTSIVHLAGGLGRPAWAMLAAMPDWRWLLEGGGSPWYPSLRLFRQASPGDWAGVLTAVQAALAAWRPELSPVNRS